MAFSLEKDSSSTGPGRLGSLLSSSLRLTDTADGEALVGRRELAADKYEIRALWDFAIVVIQ
jgi:hypothetical protein